MFFLGYCLFNYQQKEPALLMTLLTREGPRTGVLKLQPALSFYPACWSSAAQDSQEEGTS